MVTSWLITVGIANVATARGIDALRKISILVAVPGLLPAGAEAEPSGDLSLSLLLIGMVEAFHLTLNPAL
jgi:hypothetical protein